MSDQPQTTTQPEPPTDRDDEPPRPPRGQSLLLWRNRVAFLLLTVIGVLAIDQYSKLWVQNNLAAPVATAVGSDQPHFRSDGEAVIVRDIFHLRYAENPAAGFSLLRSLPAGVRLPLLIGVNVLAVVLLFAWLWRLRQPDAVLIVGIALVIAGAAGNSIDRLWHGYVIDFVVWMARRWFPAVPEWPTFNLADAAIVCGALCILFRAIRPFRSELPEVARRVIERGKR